MKLSKLINEASTDIPLKLKVLQAFDLVEFSQYDRRVYLDDALELAQGMADSDNKDWIAPIDIEAIIEILKDFEDGDKSTSGYRGTTDTERVHQIKVLTQILRFIKLNKITRIYVQ